jgi:hypothetical protein
VVVSAPVSDATPVVVVVAVVSTWVNVVVCWFCSNGGGLFFSVFWWRSMFLCRGILRLDDVGVVLVLGWFFRGVDGFGRRGVEVVSVLPVAGIVIESMSSGVFVLVVLVLHDDNDDGGGTTGILVPVHGCIMVVVVLLPVVLLVRRLGRDGRSGNGAVSFVLRLRLLLVLPMVILVVRCRGT